jgi:hypothetical protein
MVLLADHMSSKDIAVLTSSSVSAVRCVRGLKRLTGNVVQISLFVFPWHIMNSVHVDVYHSSHWSLILC